MKKRFWIKWVLLASVFCLLSCQPGGGDFVPIPQENTTIESYFENSEKKDVFQAYNDEQVSFKVRGKWSVKNGSARFYMELTNKTQKNLVIEPNDVSFNTNLEEKPVSVGLSYTVAASSTGGNSGNQKLKDAKLENGKIKIRGGQTTELDTGFYLEMKEFSKPERYFLGKEVRIGIPIKFEGQAEKNYKFAFKYDNYQ